MPWRQLCIAVLALVLTVGGCSDEVSPEQQIKAAVSAMADGVERGDRQQVGELLHEDYRDQRHPDRRAALATLFWHTRQHRQIHLLTLIRDIDLDPDGGHARTVVMVAMAGVPIASVEQLVSVKADLYRFDVEWQRSDDQWQVLSSQWQRADLSAF
jgi:hypothetical protein